MEQRIHIVESRASDPGIDADCIPEAEAAAELGKLAGRKPFAVTTLMAWRRQGIGPPWVKVGRRIVYRRAAIKIWLASKEQKRR
jgi:hypothetical protein